MHCKKTKEVYLTSKVVGYWLVQHRRCHAPWHRSCMCLWLSYKHLFSSWKHSRPHLTYLMYPLTARQPWQMKSWIEYPACTCIEQPHKKRAHFPLYICFSLMWVLCSWGRTRFVNTIIALFGRCSGILVWWNRVRHVSSESWLLSIE